ncbi:MAG: hypothetical protein J5911_06345 [Clostridia bacterium]|nr:hypothetical protein [Clostridia bacterium]
MNYHIDTGLIYEKFKENGECPLCTIEKIVQEQFLHEFLNDAVMEDNTRITVGKKGFCAKHFDMLFKRQNKLSVALQVGTRAEKIAPLLSEIKSAGAAKKRAKEIENAFNSCVICDLVEESMIKYYKTVAQMFTGEKDFYKILFSCKGFCMHHYSELLKYSSCAGFGVKAYLSVLSGVQKKNFARVQGELKAFCDSHDYRNAYKPLGDAENALPHARIKFYGEKQD